MQSEWWRSYIHSSFTLRYLLAYVTNIAVGLPCYRSEISSTLGGLGVNIS